MASYRLSNKAEKELKEIYRYSLLNFGSHQADRYLDDMEGALLFLAENPGMGRNCDYLKEGYRRHEHGQHVVYYRRLKDHILIGRILGAGQNPEKQLQS